uniref:Uncharacterized protein n=1 Tax=Panagrolaimus sp. ES5 TaxID=591445 RepID=A0AC34FNY7_9BILA
MEHDLQPPLSSSHSSEDAASSLSPKHLHDSSSSSSEKNTNMLIAFLCEKIGDSAAHHIQEVFNAKNRRLEAENDCLKARNAMLEAENARLKSQMEMKDAIISNGSPKSAASPSGSRITLFQNGDTNGNEKADLGVANKKNIEVEFNAKLTKVQEEFHRLLHASYVKQDAMESKIIKAAMEISSLKKTVADMEPKEILDEIGEVSEVLQSTRDDMDALVQRVQRLERRSSEVGTRPQPPPRRTQDSDN